MRSLFLLILVISNVFALEQSKVKDQYELLTLSERKEFHLLLMRNLIKRDLITKYQFKFPLQDAPQKKMSFYLHEFSDLFFSLAYANQINTCNFGGWVSLLDETEQCLPPWSNAVKRNEHIARYGATYSGDYSCGGADLFRCNPLLFGAGPEDRDGNGFCARANDRDPRDSTNACMQLYLADSNYMDQHLLGLANDPERLSQYLNIVVDTMKFCDENDDAFPYCPGLKNILEDHAAQAIMCANRENLVAALPQVILPVDLSQLDRIVEGLGVEANAYIEQLRQQRQAAIANNQIVYEEAITAYQQDERTGAVMDRLRANSDNCIGDACSGSKSPYSSEGKCARYVKYAFFPPNNSTSYGRWEDYPWGQDAVQSGRWLRQHGFVNLMNDPSMAGLTPENAPVGAIIVYEDVTVGAARYTVDGVSRGGPGHVEMKLSENEYVSDFINDSPTTVGGDRVPIGIYIHVPDEYTGRLQSIPEVAGE